MKKITPLIITFSLLLIISSALVAQIPTNGLVGYFPFNGNPNDQFGNSITGIPSSSGFPGTTIPVLTTDRNGNANSAYNFVPSSLSTSYIDLGQPSQFNLGNNSFSISLWMKFVDFQVQATMFSNDAWHLSIRNLGGSDHLNFVYGTASFNSDFVMSQNTWIHVAGVYNQAAQTMELYINGVLATGFMYNGSVIGPTGSANLSTSTYTLNATPTTHTEVGLIGVLTATSFKGVIDDILVYNRALTASEMSSIFSATTAPNGIDENVLGNYFTVWPNPSNGVFTLSSSVPLTKQTVLKAYAMDGRLVMEEKEVSANQLIDLSKYGSGNYLIKLETPNGYSTQKVIVQH